MSKMCETSANVYDWQFEQDKYVILLKKCLEFKQKYHNSLIMVLKQRENLKNLYKQMLCPNALANFVDIELKVLYSKQNNQNELLSVPVQTEQTNKVCIILNLLNKLSINILGIASDEHL